MGVIAYGFESREMVEEVWDAVKKVKEWENSPLFRERQPRPPQLPPWVKIVRVTGDKIKEEAAGSGSGSGSGGTECPLTYYPAVFVYDKCGKPGDGEECRAIGLNGEKLKYGKMYGGVITEIIRGKAVVKVWVSGAEGTTGSGSGSGSGSGGVTVSGTVTSYRYQCAPDSDHLIETVITYRPFFDENGNLQFEEVDTPGA
jgi:hypothetical protein